MPTTHVTWDNEPELHDIAQAVWKARKVVVITGAGISTNSGIPVSAATLLLLGISETRRTDFFDYFRIFGQKMASTH